MSEKISAVPFSGTEEQELLLNNVIEDFKGTKGALMPVLQKAQDIYGYLPIEVQKKIAKGLSVSLQEIYGVVTFYSQFSINPKGKYKVGVCMGTACYVKSAGDILERIKKNLNIDMGECTPDGLFSIEDTRCLGCCGLAPVMTINDEVYGRLVPTDVDDILKKYK